MAWTAPKTFVDGVPLTADDLNIHLRDNLLETEVAKVKIPGSYFVSSDTNAVVERTMEEDLTVGAASTSSTSYINLPNSFGPEVTVETGSSAIVIIGCNLYSSVSPDGMNRMSFAVSGATIESAIDRYSVAAFGSRAVEATYTSLRTELTPGDNTFTAKYKTSAGTATFSNRRMIVIPL